MDQQSNATPDADHPVGSAGVGSVVVDVRGAAIGTIERTYPRDAPDPEFAQIDLGTGPTLVPLTEARRRDGALEVPVTVDQIRRAPFVDAGRDLDPADLTALRDYYRDLGQEADPTGASADSDVVSLPPSGQEKVVPSEGPDDRPPTR